MLTKSLALFLLPALAAAQYGGPPVGPASGGTTSAPAAAPSAPPSTSSQINIDVGAGGQFVFNPQNVTAAVGTLVTFYFPGNIAHSVTQSSFAEPCTYLAASSNSSGGFDSGLVSQPATFTINITIHPFTAIWFHCKAPTHCPTGMVGSINAPATGNTFDMFQSAAKALGSNAPTETDNGPVTGGVGAVATAAPSSDVGGSGSGSGSSSGASQVVASASLALLSAAVAVFIL